MFIYTVIEAVIGIAAGIFIAVRTKRSKEVVCGKLDKAGRITNILLFLVYVRFAPVYLVLGAVVDPHCGDLPLFPGWIVSVIIASATLFCGIGLGLSVALRRRGRSKLSFVVQFAGAVGIGLSVLLFMTCFEDVLSPII